MAHRVNEIMTPIPECCTPDDSIIEVARVMEQRDVGAVPIVESQDTRRVVGIITDRDIVLRVVAEGPDPNAVIGAREVMTPEIVSCGPDDDVAEVEELMKQHQVRRILVLDEQGSVVGIVATADLARAADDSKLGDTMKSITHP